LYLGVGVNPEIAKYMSDNGIKGGKAGRGLSKVRGGKEYYSAISKLSLISKQAQKANSKKEQECQNSPSPSLPTLP